MKTISRATVLAALLLLTSASVQAVPMLSTQVILYPGEGAIDDILWEDGGATLSRSLTTGFDTSTYTASGSATATYGSLGARAEASLTNYPSQSYYVPCNNSSSATCGMGTYFGIGLSAASARARFEDSLTLSGGTGQAYVVFEFDVDGTSSISSTGGVSASSTFFMLVNSPGEFGLVNFGTTSGPRHLESRALEVTFGVPFDITVNFTAGIRAFDVDPDSGPYDLDGTAVFDTTASLTGFKVYSDDALLNELGNYTILADSGTTYPGSMRTSVAPEPGTLPLLGLAALLLGANGRWPRRLRHVRAL